MAKASAEDQKKLNIRVLERNGFLSEGKRHWNWFNEDGELVAAIMIEAQRSRVVLLYHAQEPGGEWEKIDDPISLDQTIALGRMRRWFLCPGCSKRVAILYLRKYFRCRHCLRLGYRSQKARPSQRALSRIREIP